MVVNRGGFRMELKNKARLLFVQYGAKLIECDLVLLFEWV